MLVSCTTNLAQGDPIPTPKSRSDVMRIASDPAVSTVTVSAAGNLSAVFVSPVCTILSAIEKSPVNVPVEPATVPPLIFPVTFPVNAPTKVVAVVTPVKNPSPSLLKVIPLPTTIPFLAVINPTESTLVTSS